MRTLLFAVALFASACIDMSEPDVNQRPQAARVLNKLAANKLAANKLAANKLAANKLAANAITSQKLVALSETAGIMQTRSGRQVYSYLMSCTLNDGMAIIKDDVMDCDPDNNGVVEPGSMCSPANDPAPTSEFDDPQFCVAGHCEFHGLLGLAPDWANRKLSGSGQGWVSACMFARINAQGIAEGISLRGSHPALAIDPTSDEAQTFILEEGAFYGNMFNQADAPINWNSCMGSTQYQWLNDGTEFPNEAGSGSLYGRDCTEPSVENDGTTACGFNDAGLCGTFASTDYACKSHNTLSGFYGDCHEDDGPGKWGGIANYRQVITVYISP